MKKITDIIVGKVSIFLLVLFIQDRLKDNEYVSDIKVKDVYLYGISGGV